MRKISTILLALFLGLALATQSFAHDGPVRRSVKATACVVHNTAARTHNFIRSRPVARVASVPVRAAQGVYQAAPVKNTLRRVFCR